MQLQEERRLEEARIAAAAASAAEVDSSTASRLRHERLADATLKMQQSQAKVDALAAVPAPRVVTYTPHGVGAHAPAANDPSLFCMTGKASHMKAIEQRGVKSLDEVSRQTAARLSDPRFEALLRHLDALLAVLGLATSWKVTFDLSDIAICPDLALADPIARKLYLAPSPSTTPDDLARAAIRALASVDLRGTGAGESPTDRLVDMIARSLHVLPSAPTPAPAAQGTLLVSIPAL